MSLMDGFNPLEAIDAMLSRIPSEEVLLGVRERFPVISQAVAETAAAFAFIHETHVDALERVTAIASASDAILPKEIELSPDAEALHVANIASNADNVPTIHRYNPIVSIAESSIDDERQKRIADALAATETAFGKSSSEVPLFVENPDGLHYTRNGVIEKKAA